MIAPSPPGTPESSRRGPWARGALIGALSALVASGVMLWIGSNTGGSILAQVLSDRMIDLLPVSVFRRTLAELGSNTRPVALLMFTATQMLMGALVGAIYARRWASTGITRRIAGGSAAALSIWFMLGLFVGPLADIGFFARNASDPAATQLAFAAAAVTFGLGIGLFVPWPRLEPAFDGSRRRLVQSGGVAALALPALLASGYIARHVQRMRSTYDSGLAVLSEDGEGPFAFAGMPQEITPTEAFYVVSKNFVDPTVDSSGWTLEVGGLVERPLSLSYTDLLLRDSQEIIATLECISNTVGGSYISNAVWEGFPLSTLLDEAGLMPGIVDLEIHAADGYIESIPIEKAMDDVMLVHSMNGEPLNDEHGYPVRMIVPGIYGMKNVKWVTAINAVPGDIQGFWQERGWSDIATIFTMSRIDVPEKGRKLNIGETMRAGGVTFGGNRGISRVEVSFDRGETWNEAQLSEPLSDLAWRLWRYEYTADSPGMKRITVRATNGDGQLQDETFREPVPDGSTGWHEDWFEVV